MSFDIKYIQTIGRMFRYNKKTGMNEVDPEVYRKAIQSTKIYSILSICKYMMDNGDSFEDVMEYCSDRVIKEELVFCYVAYVLRDFFSFGLKQYGPLITDKIVSKLILFEEIYTSMFPDDFSKVINLNEESPYVKRALNHLKLKDPNCIFLGNSDGAGAKNVNINLLYLQIQVMTPDHIREGTIKTELIRMCDYPTVKSLGGFRG